MAVSTRKPLVKKVSVRSASHHLAGNEQPYPVYQFSNRVFIERPKHNPFDDLAGAGFSIGFSGGFA